MPWACIPFCVFRSVLQTSKGVVTAAATAPANAPIIYSHVKSNKNKF